MNAIGIGKNLYLTGKEQTCLFLKYPATGPESPLVIFA